MFDGGQPYSLTLRLVVASEPKPAKHREVTKDAVDGLGPLSDPAEAEIDFDDAPVTESGRISQIFTVALVCRQIYNESALLQYSKNIFLFNNEIALGAFAMNLNDEQRTAISAISVDLDFVHDMVVNGTPARQFYGIHTPLILDLLPGLKAIYFAPKYLPYFHGETEREKVATVIEALEFGGQADLGLCFWCFDILDARADVNTAWGVRFTHAIRRKIRMV